MKIEDILKDYADHLYMIEEDSSVDKALNLMSGYNVSSLMVVLDNIPKGIFTERDIVRCHILYPDKDINFIAVKDVMTKKLIVAEPADTIEDAMGMMITAKIRHLPVVQKGQIKGMLCLEDLVKKHIKVLTRELHYLKDYISDLQDAAHD